jgi:hypothetical protein
MGSVSGWMTGVNAAVYRVGMMQVGWSHDAFFLILSSWLLYVEFEMHCRIPYLSVVM